MSRATARSDEAQKLKSGKFRLRHHVSKAGCFEPHTPVVTTSHHYHQRQEGSSSPYVRSTILYSLCKDRGSDEPLFSIYRNSFTRLSSVRRERATSSGERAAKPPAIPTITPQPTNTVLPSRYSRLANKCWLPSSGSLSRFSRIDFLEGSASPNGNPLLQAAGRGIWRPSTQSTRMPLESLNGPFLQGFRQMEFLLPNQPHRPQCLPKDFRTASVSHPTHPQ